MVKTEERLHMWSGKCRQSLKKLVKYPFPAELPPPLEIRPKNKNKVSILASAGLALSKGLRHSDNIKVS